MATQGATHMISATPLFQKRGEGLLLDTLFDLWRSRNTLAQLDSAALEDIGLSARDAHSEAQKPFWDVPANWRK